MCLRNAAVQPCRHFRDKTLGFGAVSFSSGENNVGNGWPRGLSGFRSDDSCYWGTCFCIYFADSRWSLFCPRGLCGYIPDDVWPQEFVCPRPVARRKTAPSPPSSVPNFDANNSQQVDTRYSTNISRQPWGPCTLLTNRHNIPLLAVFLWQSSAL